MANLDTIFLPELPLGSPERAEVFKELRKTFREDWMAAEKAWPDERRHKLGDLYFVAAGNAVKIGRTKNMAQRMRHIQAHNHEKAECLLLLEGQGWREREYHKLFADFRVNGEWFRRCPEIEDEIERLSNA